MMDMLFEKLISLRLNILLYPEPTEKQANEDFDQGKHVLHVACFKVTAARKEGCVR